MSRKAAEGSAERVRRDIEDRGAWIAYEALLGIAQDSSAPAPARATAGVAVLRAGGILDAKKEPRADQAAEMTGDELRAALASMQNEAKRIEAAMAGRAALVDPRDDGDESDSVFA